MELLAGRIGRSEPDDVRLAAQALAALRPLHDSILGVDLRGADDVISWPAACGGHVGGVEVRLDHDARRRFIHESSLPGAYLSSLRGGERSSGSNSARTLLNAVGWRQRCWSKHVSVSTS